jgi:tripartite-type tricarboxylate transporter receptor subunit TctC
MFRLTMAVCAGLLAATTSLPFGALAQDNYPNRPIKIIVPIPPGATADTLPRVIGDKLSKAWDQPVVIENKPGASNNLAAEFVAKAPADGYTIFATPPGPLVTAGSMGTALRFDPQAFTPITIMATLPNTLVVRADLPVSNLQELVAYAKANPGKLTYASAGNGSTPHLAGAALQIAAGVSLIHVPYKGLAPALTDVLAGHIDMLFDNIGNTLPHIKSGKVKGIAVADQVRSPELPDLPTVAETYPGFYSTTWFALVGPPNMPPAIANKIRAEVARILKTPDLVNLYKQLAANPGGNTPEEMKAFLGDERQRWDKVIKTAGIKEE